MLKTLIQELAPSRMLAFVAHDPLGPRSGRSDRKARWERTGDPPRDRGRNFSSRTRVEVGARCVTVSPRRFQPLTMRSLGEPAREDRRSDPRLPGRSNEAVS